MSKLVSTARFEIVKPIGMSWDELGKLFRAIRAPMHRVMNEACTQLEMYAYANGGGKQVERKAETRCYQLVRDKWQTERQAAQERVSKGKFYPLDEDLAVLNIGSQVLNGYKSQVYSRWKKWRDERWKGTMSLPSWRAKGPIYIGSSSKAVQVLERDGTHTLKLKLLSGKDVTMVITGDGPSSWADLKWMAANHDHVGDCKIEQRKDRKTKKRKWYALIAVKRPEREQQTGATMAIHRGMRCFLTIAIARHEGRDAYTRVLETGDDVLRHKLAYRARRRSLGAQGRQLGKDAKGHGVARRHERITQLENADERWVTTKCQQVAASAMRYAKRHGVGRILLEDWTNPAKDGAPELGDVVEYYVRSFPFERLAASIIWAARKKGLVVERVKTDNNSRTCPHCRHEHAKAQVGTFMCEACRFERPVDVVFAWNVLLRDGKTPGIAEAKRAEKRIRKKLDGAS